MNKASPIPLQPNYHTAQREKRKNVRGGRPSESRATDCTLGKHPANERASVLPLLDHGLPDARVQNGHTQQEEYELSDPCWVSSFVRQVTWQPKIHGLYHLGRIWIGYGLPSRRNFNQTYPNQTCSHLKCNRQSPRLSSKRETRNQLAQ